MVRLRQRRHRPNLVVKTIQTLFDRGFRARDRGRTSTSMHRFCPHPWSPCFISLAPKTTSATDTNDRASQFACRPFGLPLPFQHHVQLLLFASSAPVACFRCERYQTNQIHVSLSSPVLQGSEDYNSDYSLPETNCLTPESYNPCFDSRFIFNNPRPVSPPTHPVASPHFTNIVSVSSLSLSLGCASFLTSRPMYKHYQKAKDHLHDYTSKMLSKSRCSTIWVSRCSL